MRPALLALFAVALGCSNYPESYPPPIQRDAATGTFAPRFRSLLEMNRPGVEGYFIADIRALEGNAWRWTGPRPAMRFILERIEGLRFIMDFAIPGVTFEQTGPVTVSVHLNGRLLARERYTAYGEQHFERAVDPSWLAVGEDTIVEVEIEPSWLGPDNQTRLGFILSRAGFVE